jgi:lactate dehydrogenase-like 2-hydroxyacid dehydrogenase
MKIAILNECFFTEDHLERLRKVGKLKVYRNTNSEEKAIKRLKGADIAIVDGFVCPLTAPVMDSTENLKLLALNSTATEICDIEAATAKSIKVSNIPSYSTDSVAEHTIGLMLAFAKRIPELDRRTRKKPFIIDPNSKKHQVFMSQNLKGKTLGIIGLGMIGTRLAELALSFKMHVIAYNRSAKQVPGVKLVPMEELLAKSDFVSLNLRSVDETKGIISAKELSLMKPTSVLINSASFKLVDSKALSAALKNKVIAGAALDVFDKSDPELMKLDNVIVTPHSAWFTKEAMKNLADTLVANVEAFSSGHPINIVN